MILEIADIRITPGKNAEFEASIERGLATVVTRAKGYRAHKVHKGIESPDRYALMIWWDTLENHTVDFRQGPLFPEWRTFIGPFFAAGVPPAVEHFTLVHESA
ncbi:MAG: antibiotic biosynthesis monooxygenase [Caldimonas sp.]